LSKAGWSWGCVATVDRRGQTIFVADAHRDNGRRFVVRADEKLTAFLELERITRESSYAEASFIPDENQKSTKSEAHDTMKIERNNRDNPERVSQMHSEG
jgi:hypothetical protein